MFAQVADQRHLVELGLGAARLGFFQPPGLLLVGMGAGRFAADNSGKKKGGH